MIRSLVCIAIALAVCSPAFADDSPTPAQIDAAKQAYADGKALHDKGNFTEAVEKFKESYRLSKNPMLLYNIALTMEEIGGKDLALLYYRQFLTDAPANADQRPTAVERVKALEKELAKQAEPPKSNNRNAIKPPGTYSATDFEHQVVEEAPPNQPLDLTASVPADSGFKVTLFYRNAGEGEFSAQPMKSRYKELVARIPAARMTGTTVQYYIEVRDTEGNLVTRAGKSIEPNLISIDANAKPKFYPDLTDDTANAHPDTSSNPEDEDPLHPHKHIPKPVEPDLVAPVTFDRHEGLTDVGSSKFGAVKWTATVGAVAFLGAAVVFAVRAHNEAKSLQEDATACGTPPCRMFDSAYDADLESTGRRDDTIFGVTLGIGIASAAVASYYWYKEQNVQQPPQSTTAWHVIPAIDNRSIGATATARF